MNITFRTTAAAIAVSIVSLQCAAQVSKVSPEDMMDAAFDMKKASEAADKLASDGSKYCGWDTAPLDTSDLDVAISRFLLNHGSHVPENVLASKMWRVSFVAGDIIHGLAMGASECDVKLRYSDETRRVALASSSVLRKLMLARSSFNALADRQTIWQEQNSQERGNDEKSEGQGTSKVSTGDILIAGKEIEEAANAAGMVTTRSRTTSGCVRADASAKALDLADLAGAVDYMTRLSHSRSTIAAGNMWVVAHYAEASQIDILTTLEACSAYAAEKKQARNTATESLQVYRRLTTAIAAFDVLALRQTEWEEQTAAQKQPTVQEQ